MIASYLFGTLIVLFMVATLVAVVPWRWVWSTCSIARLATSSRPGGALRTASCGAL